MRQWGIFGYYQNTFLASDKPVLKTMVGTKMNRGRWLELDTGPVIIRIAIPIEPQSLVWYF